MAHFATDRPVTVTMMTIVMVLFGVLSYMILPRDLFPDISRPALTVVTEYEGAASRDIESLVTKKIEEKLGAVKGVRSMKSISGNERSQVMLEFNWGTNMDLALMDVREKLDQVKDDLPDKAESPVISRASLTSSAVVVVNVSARPGAQFQEANLRNVVDERVKLRLERIDGVAAVVLSGGDEYEVRIELDQARLESYQLNNEDVRQALERENISQRGGKVSEGRKDYLVRTVGKYTRVQNVGRTVVATRDGEPIYLNRVAHRIEKRAKRRTDLARLKSEDADRPAESIELAIFKKPGGNSVAISADTRAFIKEIQAEEKELAFAVSYDEAVFINESLEMVMGNFKLGLILSTLVLLVFLRSVQSTLVVFLSMPVSVISAFMLFRVQGMTLNVFSLAGLTLAVGMVVDNAIVVIEASFAHLAHERRVKKAIVEAVQEVRAPVVASTLTTLAVFLPIAFVPGIAGQVFRDLSFTVTYSLIFSLIVAFTLIPMLTNAMLSRDITLFKWLNLIPELLFSKILRLTDFGRATTVVYQWLLKGILRTWYTRLAVLAGVVVLFVLSFRLMPPSEFFPDTAQKEYEVVVETPTGSTLDFTDQKVAAAEDVISRSVQPLPGASVSARLVSAHKARIVLNFEKPVDKTAGIARIKNITGTFGVPPGDIRVRAGSLLKLLSKQATRFTATIRLPADEGTVRPAREGPPADPAALVARIAGALEAQIAKPAVVFATTVTSGQARIIVSLDSPAHGAATAARIRKGLADIPEITYKVASISPLRALQAGTRGDIEIKVSGFRLDTLRDLALGNEERHVKGLVDIAAGVEGVLGVSTSVGQGSPEIHVLVDRRRAADLGLSVQEIADAIEIAVAGQKATDIETDAGTYDIRLSAGASQFRSEEDLHRLRIRTRRGAFVNLEDVAAVQRRRGPTAIVREERQRVEYVWLDKKRDVALGDLAARLMTPEESRFQKSVKRIKTRLGMETEPARKAKAALDDFPLPEGYVMQLGGAGQAMKESFGYLVAALVIAILLVYMVMASQFESVIHPLTIMFSVPIALTGAFVGLWLSGDNLSITGLIGIIMLAGIVVNNAIILVDYTNILRARGQNRNEAIVQAGVTRMRPIFMTTMTTVLGMLPMALGFGAGAELYKPLAVVVIGGLSFCTVLTLVFIPTVYCLFDDVIDLIGFIRFRLSILFSSK